MSRHQCAALVLALGSVSAQTAGQTWPAVVLFLLALGFALLGDEA